MSSSPTFVATFADGTETRMTTYCEGSKLDVRRGVRLACHAHRSRKGQEPPAITNAWFESPDGAVLAEYSAEQLAEMVP